jgi:hypothetical protein
MDKPREKVRTRAFRFAIVGGVLGVAVVVLLSLFGPSSVEGRGLWAVILGIPASPILLVVVYALDLVTPSDSVGFALVVAYWPFASLIINWVAVGWWWGYSTRASENAES